MKKRRILHLGLLMLALTLVTTSLVSGTLAKYITTRDGTGTLTVAHWQIKLGKDAGTAAEGTAEFELAGTVDPDDAVKEGLIAPGTTGSFSMYYDTSGTEVSHTISIAIEKTGTWYDGIKFFKDAGRTQELSFTGNTATMDAITVAHDEANKTGTVSVYWGWDFENGVDTADTTTGEAQPSYALKAKATVTQIDGDVYNP